MYEINSEEVDGYENRDNEYAVELWDYHRGFLTVEDLIDLLADSFYQSGIEALEKEALEGFSQSLTQYRPPAQSSSSFYARVKSHIKNMPPRLALHAWQSELDMWSNRSTKEGQMTMVLMLEVGEEVFDVDLTNEVVEELKHMDECETKIDLLEARGAITGVEWYDRHDALNADEEVTA